MILLVWWLAVLLWSSTFLFIRIGLADIPPLTFAWVRLTIAVLVLAPFAWARARALPRGQAGHVAVAGLIVLGLNYALTFWGAQHVPSGLVAILQSGTPVLAMLFAWGFGLERPTVRKLSAFACGIAGVVLIVGAEARTPGDRGVAGALAVFGGSAAVAFGYVWLKRYAVKVPPTVTVTIQAAVAAVALAAGAFILEGAPAPARWTGTSWVALLYLAICASVGAASLNYWLLARIDASAMLLMGIAEVPIAIGLGAIVLGERLHAWSWAGAILIVVSVAAGLRTGGRAAPAPASPST